MSDKEIRLADATTADLANAIASGVHAGMARALRGERAEIAEAIAAGVHVGLRRLAADAEAFGWLRKTVEKVFPDGP